MSRSRSDLLSVADRNLSRPDGLLLTPLRSRPTGLGFNENMLVTASSTGEGPVGGGKNFMHPGNCFDLNGADMKDLFYTFSTFLNLGWANYQGSSNLLSI